MGHTADAGVGPDVFTGFNHIDDGVDGEDDSHDADGGADTAHERQGKEVAAHGYTGVSDGSKDRNEESQTIMVPKDSSMPPFCMRKMDVTRIKAAQPFMLMVVQMGRTKRLMEGLMRMFSSAEAMVTGSVAAELFVKRATARAGDMAFMTRTGLRPRMRRKSGRTMKNWMRFPAMMTRV